MAFNVLSGRGARVSLQRLLLTSQQSFFPDVADEMLDVRCAVPRRMLKATIPSAGLGAGQRVRFRLLKSDITPRYLLFLDKK